MKPIHILLVEDNEGDIVLTKKALNDAKLANTISIAKNGADALLFLERKGKFENELTPDMILLDINLPKVSGLEVLQKIKASEELRHIPVIMLTTSSSEIDILASYKNYANCYITKPVNIPEFLKVISTLDEFWISIVQLPTRIKK